MIYARIAGVLAVISALAWIYNAIDQRGYARAQSEYSERERIALIEYANRITTAGVQHDKDQATINRLSAAGRVRVQFPVCKSAGTEASSNEAGGVLSNRMDELFGRFQSRVGILIEECAKLNIDAIEHNSSCSK